MLDEKNPAMDRRISERVIMNHRFHDGQVSFDERRIEDDAIVEPNFDLMEYSDNQDVETKVFEKERLLGHEKRDKVRMEFLKKYIAYTKV
jgi:DNA replicative helicase MCM subunit Mcm2 (Cdc46/Mcm family)